MPGPCHACVHFRPERQPSHLLSLAWTLDTSEAIARNRDVERQLHTTENRMKRSLMEANHTAWPRPPQVLAYCGLREHEGVHYIHELKNRGGICRDFRPVGDREASPESRRPSWPLGSF